MACYTPLSAWVSEHQFNNATQKTFKRISFKEDAEHNRPLKLPCGQCIGCRLERSRQWAVRCMHEAQMHEENCFITLTYDEEHLPEDLSLRYEHFQTFIRALRDYFRKHYGKTGIRFYMGAEYGETFGRPHYHACIFGINFPDRKPFKKSPSGSMLYVSEILKKLWPYGYSSIGDVNFESAAYVARYIMKKMTGTRPDENGITPEDHYTYCDLSTGELIKRKPEFNKMSLKPGIGAKWIEKYMTDVYPEDKIVIRGKKTTKPPRYYDKMLKKLYPEDFHELKLEREEKSFEIDHREFEAERLKVKESVTKAKLRKLKRKID